LGYIRRRLPNLRDTPAAKTSPTDCSLRVEMEYYDSMNDLYIGALLMGEKWIDQIVKL